MLKVCKDRILFSYVSGRRKKEKRKKKKEDEQNLNFQVWLIVSNLLKVSGTFGVDTALEY